MRISGQLLRIISEFIESIIIITIVVHESVSEINKEDLRELTLRGEWIIEENTNNDGKMRVELRFKSGEYKY